MPPIPPGTRLGHYEVLSQLGAGGMGEVYLAYDSTLDRKVALKILPPEVASRSDRMRRFVQEAKAAAALNHPNLAHVYEIGEHDSRQFIAMEFIDGTTLSSKIHREKTPLTKLLEYLRHVAEGLAKAHAAGIVHRDLKPDNIMVSKDDHVKVLDFGLAKLAKTEAITISPEAETQSPSTTPGAVIGTVGYMSPEQAQGKIDEIDARSDTFSFGCILFEAATGHRPFEDKSAIRSLHKLVYEPAPALSEFNVDAPPELQRIIRRCLEKDPEDRYQSIKDVAIELRELRNDSQTTTATRHSKRLFAAAAVAIVILAGAAGLYLSTRQRPSSRTSQVRVVPFTSFQGREDQAALSPDGNQIAFVWDGDKGENVDIYVKSLNSDSPLRVTTNPALDLFPAWSPDGQKLAFVRIVPSVKITVFMTSALGTSSERLLIDLKTAPDSLSWSPDGKLIATSDSPSSQRAILLFSPETGERRYVTSPPPLYAGDANPVFSPDGKKIAFIRNNNPITGDIYVVPITGGEPRRVTSDNAEFFFGNGIVGGLAWTTDGQELVFSSSRGGIPALWRVALSGGEPERLAVGGDDTYYPSISSKGDRLTYTKRSGGTTVYQVDIRNVGPVTKLFSSSQADENVEYSPDGKKIAFNSYRSGTSEIWICDNDGTHLTQLTSFGKGKAGTPRWSPDGRFVAFDYRAVDTSNVYVANIAGGAPNCITTETKDDSVPSWSSDGNFIYLQSDRGGDLQIWRVPVAGGPGVQVTRHGGLYSFESQDGRYLYYNNPTYSTATRSSGVWRVPVAGGEEELVLDKGNAGTWGHWTISGENIYFISVASDGSLFLNALDMVTRRITQLTTLAQPLSEITSIDVSPDQRSLIFTQQNPISSDIMLVENFR